MRRKVVLNNEQSNRGSLGEWLHGVAMVNDYMIGGMTSLSFEIIRGSIDIPLVPTSLSEISRLALQPPQLWSKWRRV